MKCGTMIISTTSAYKMVFTTLGLKRSTQFMLIFPHSFLFYANHQFLGNLTMSAALLTPYPLPTLLCLAFCTVAQISVPMFACFALKSITPNRI
jgi:hypothetical protein